MNGIVLFCFIYVAGIVFSFVVLIYHVQEFEDNPHLVDHRWKRFLWLLSSLILVPALLVLSRGPRLMIRDLIEFVQGD